jgi:hypothetical protein
MRVVADHDLLVVLVLRGRRGRACREHRRTPTTPRMPATIAGANRRLNRRTGSLDVATEMTLWTWYARLDSGP